MLPWFAAALAAQQPHWAFVAPVRPAVPSLAVELADGVRNDVDRFVRARWGEHGLIGTAPATRGELLRRVTFDLTGLPPSLAELDAFERDERPDAYERVVDRLLATTAAAEESARWWLDLSRYADTHGMQRDQVRALWRWRDWVIDAYAANVPFDRFVTEQLAGDLLPAATDAQRIASGWNRNNPTSDEGGLIPEEYLARYAMNRTDTFGTALLGLTVGCAQCHDHKSDPLPQRDYYRLLAYFASFAEDGNDGGALAPAPAIRAPRAHEAAALAERGAARDAARARVDAIVWTSMPFASTEAANALVARPDGALLARGVAPERGDYELRGAAMPGLRSLRLTAMPDDALPARGPGRADNGNFVLGELELFAVGAVGETRIALVDADAEYAQPGHDARAVLDGDPATGWAMQGLHESNALHVRLAQPLPDGVQGLRLVLRHQSPHARHLLGCFALHGTSDDVGPVLTAWRAAVTAFDELANSVPQCLVSGELAEPRAVHVLVRGRYDVKGEQVAPGTPACLPPLPTTAPADRRALAAWLFAPGHPLTARVAVNRIWLRHFGRGLVATPHDFGRLGAPPSHRELLDWLACEFVERGWDERHLHRLLVTSATYRQSARATAAARQRDPGNVWLARGSRVRLPAEAIRDQALAVAQLLLMEVGGASVRIEQPPGIWEAVAFPGSNTERYAADAGDALRRRSLYTFWKRSAPPPLLTTLDAPSRETCVVERGTTTTPLQTLALWNDTGMARAMTEFGARIAASAGKPADAASSTGAASPERTQGDEGRAAGDREAATPRSQADAGCITFAFRTLLQRSPDAEELVACRTLLALAREQGADPWAALATTLGSLDEALHR